MNDDMCQESQAVPHAAHLVLMGRRDKRPVDEHGTANHIFLWNESPEAAVITDVAVVAHSEVVIRRYNNVVTLDVARQFSLPLPSDAVHVLRNGGEIFAIR